MASSCSRSDSDRDRWKMGFQESNHSSDLEDDDRTLFTQLQDGTTSFYGEDSESESSSLAPGKRRLPCYSEQLEQMKLHRRYSEGNVLSRIFVLWLIFMKYIPDESPPGLDRTTWNHILEYSTEITHKFVPWQKKRFLLKIDPFIEEYYLFLTQSGSEKEVGLLLYEKNETVHKWWDDSEIFQPIKFKGIGTDTEVCRSFTLPDPLCQMPWETMEQYTEVLRRFRFVLNETLVNCLGTENLTELVKQGFGQAKFISTIRPFFECYSEALQKACTHPIEVLKLISISFHKSPSVSLQERDYPLQKKPRLMGLQSDTGPRFDVSGSIIGRIYLFWLLFTMDRPSLRPSVEASLDERIKKITNTIGSLTLTDEKSYGRIQYRVPKALSSVYHHMIVHGQLCTIPCKKKDINYSASWLKCSGIFQLISLNSGTKQDLFSIHTITLPPALVCAQHVRKLSDENLLRAIGLICKLTLEKALSPAQLHFYSKNGFNPNSTIPTRKSWEECFSEAMKEWGSFKDSF